MRYIDSMSGQCPYCGELIDVVIDASQDEGSYIEDCEVCCQPMVVYPILDDNHEVVGVRLVTENDA